MSDFWSRRKARVEAETRAERAAAAEAALAEEAARQEARPDEELLAEAGLPEPEAIDSAEMLQQFLRSTLPQRLKRRAMRAHWKANPVLACMDGLNDYEEDFATAELIGDAVRTTYQVGRGLLAHIEEMERAEEAEAETVLAEAEEVEETILAATAETDSETPTHDIRDAAPEAGTDEDASAPAPSSRRMRFRFDTA